MFDGLWTGSVHASMWYYILTRNMYNNIVDHLLCFLRVTCTVYPDWPGESALLTCNMTHHIRAHGKISS